MAGVCISEPTEKRSTALQEGLITYTSWEGKSRSGEKAYWALRLEAEGEPFRGTQPIPQPIPLPETSLSQQKIRRRNFPKQML